MSRFTTIDPAAATGPARELLDAVHGKLGRVPNMMGAMANAPAALKGYLELSGALGEGGLSAALREKLALRAAQTNGCDYCLAAHTAIAGMHKVPQDQILDARRGVSEDAQDAAALRFLDAVIESKGNVDDAVVADARAAGLGDGEMTEIVANVALNIFTNYFNSVSQADVDFPIVPADVEEAAKA